MTYHSNKNGSVITSLVLTALGVIFVGFLVTSKITIPKTNLPTRADTNSPCFYSTVAVVLHEDETIVTYEENGLQEWGVSNSLQLKLNPGVIAGPFGRFDDNSNNIHEYFENSGIYKYNNDNQKFGPLNDENAVHEGEPISVTLMGLHNDLWEVSSVFCESQNPDFSACPTDIASQTPSETINNFIPKCGTNITYGWVVKKKDNTTITPTTPLTDDPTTTPVAPSNTPTNAPTNSISTAPTYSVTETPTNPSPIEPSPTSSQNLICNKKDDPCEDFYSEKCTTKTGAQGVKECHKKGFCMERGDGTKCSWNPDTSSCGNCITNDSPDNDPPPGDNTSPDCQHIVGSGSKRVLFIPYNFSNASQFAKYTSRAISDIRSTNLGSLYNGFSFIAYNKLNGNYGCKEGSPVYGGTQYGCTDYSAIKSAMSKCNATAALVIANVSGLGGMATIGGGIASVKIGTITFSAHELGHAIAGLYDEYNFGKTMSASKNTPNCSSSSNCLWKQKYPSLGCIPVCGFTNWYRPTEKSVMNNGGNKNKLWNQVSLDAWARVMPGGQTSFEYPLESEDRMYRTALYINLRQNQRNELSLEDMQIKQSYPIDLDQNLQEDHFTVKMITLAGNVLYSGQFKVNETRISDPGGQEEVMREIIPLYLPYYENLYSVEIYDTNNQKKLDIDLDEYDLPTPTPPTNLCGNGVCDASEGENRDTCEADCAQQNEHRDEYKILASDVNEDGYVNILDCSICLMEFKNQPDEIACDIITNDTVDALDYSACLNNLGEKVNRPTEAPYETQTPTQSPPPTTRPTAFPTETRPTPTTSPSGGEGPVL